MSPSGLSKLAPTKHRRDAKKTFENHLLVVCLIFSNMCIARCASISDDVSIEENISERVIFQNLKTTPTYDSDYEENGVDLGGGNEFDASIGTNDQIKETIIPIKDISDFGQLTKFGVDGQSGFLDGEVVEKIVSDIGGSVTLAAKPTKANVIGETQTYCAEFESKCRCSPDGKELVCKNAGFVEVPSNLPSSLIKLDLHSNNITTLKATSFSSLADLEELILSDNPLTTIPPGVLKSVPHLKRLLLHACGLQHVPTEGLAHLPHLTYLNLAYNQLTDLPADAFPVMEHLTVLLLKRNHISTIDERAFSNLTALKILELDDNRLGDIPFAIHHLPTLQELSISNNRIKYIGQGVLQKCPGLALLELKGNPLVGVDPHAFSFLPKLKKLILSDARDLSIFPSLNGTSSLETLRIDRASLVAVPKGLCITCPKLKTLDLKSNKLTKVPDLANCKDLRVLDLALNHITSVEGRLFKTLGQLHDLLLPHNLIDSIPRDAFYGLTKLQVLNMDDNKISSIHPDAFLPISKIEDLNLGNNAFPNLPASGLQKLLHLKTFNNPFLKEFHQPETFPRIQTLVLSYAYHCCAFMPEEYMASYWGGEPAPTEPPFKDRVIFPSLDADFDPALWNSNSTDLWPQYDNLTHKFGSQMKDLLESFGSDFTYPGNLPAYAEEYFEVEPGRIGSGGSGLVERRAQCLPLPGPFLPCQDLFDWWTLRCGVWVVFLLAMLGNGTVVFVLIFSRSKMDVPRFLVCNLAAADFFMGIYLGFLAVVDASTLGEFRMYAIPWQMSAGCQLAGFLGVLSSELSVFTLAVITLERNYAITHAMHLNKRLSLKHAGYIMLIGWSFSLTMATLPLFGVSDYRKFAICLPFETTNGPASLAYVVFLMFINGVAFLTLMGCYLKMYCAIRGSQAWNSNDSRIAKRMALLVFTDFLCWFPIAFFSLTASFGLQLISLEQAKVFTVFILPLNSCCNPFLYAILTKQFKKDCVLICKAIEESRVTRGIGRCRHSSNFSNRQTPANTNSLVDRSSRDHQQHAPACSCSAKLLSDSGGVVPGANGRNPRPEPAPKNWFVIRARTFFNCLQPDSTQRHRARSDQYAYQIAEIQQKQHKRASSVSSSENFSSSRSDSWRHNHHCGIPLRLLDPKRRTSSWLVSRKTSQDSNLSSSRNDSSGSATTASTSTWRMSRSSASSEPSRSRVKPRLTRQHAIRDELGEPPGSPGRLTVRFLTTIPSCAETSMQMDEEPASPGRPTQEQSCNPTQETIYPVAEPPQGEALYAVLHAGGGAPLTTLHPVGELPLDAEKCLPKESEPT